MREWMDGLLRAEDERVWRAENQWRAETCGTCACMRTTGGWVVGNCEIDEGRERYWLCMRDPCEPLVLPDGSGQAACEDWEPAS